MRYTDKRKLEMQAREENRQQREVARTQRMPEPEIMFWLDHRTQIFVRLSRVRKYADRYRRMAGAASEPEMETYILRNKRQSPPVPELKEPRTAESYLPRLIF